MRLLLLSNSTMAGQEYFAYPEAYIKDFLGNNIKKILFVPYAGVTISWDDYAEKVTQRFAQWGYEVESIHKKSDAPKAAMQAECIMVGGGNTWQLVDQLHRNHLIKIVRHRIANDGAPYIGWSAGTNVACPSIRTTNDMPIVIPQSFYSFSLVPFQINPHYTDAQLVGFGGETREMRIQEFVTANPQLTVVGLREGTMLRREGSSVRLLGNDTVKIFKHGQATQELTANDPLDFLLQTNI